MTTAQENQQVLEIEEYILGAFLVDHKVFRDQSATIDETDFFFVASQLIFRAIDAVYQARNTTAPILVTKRLRETEDINRVGGIGYIGELHSKIAETESTGFYIEILKDQSNRRKIALLGSELQSMSKDENIPPADAIAKIQSKFAGISVSTSLDYITAPELLAKEVEPVKWIVEDLIPSGLTILAGDAKIGKSFLCWNLALAVSQGGIALSGFNVPKPRKSTYIALEDPPALIAERIRMLSGNESVTESLNIITSLPYNLKFDHSGIAVIDNYIKESQTEFLIIDTWKHVRPDIRGNQSAYEIDYEALIPVQRLAHDNDIAVLLVTHTRKSPDPDNPFNQIQGSMGVQAGCDTMLMLTKSNGSHTLNITGRRMIQDEYPMEMSNGLWSVLSKEQQSEKIANNSKQKILRAIGQGNGDGMSVGDIVKLSGLNAPNVKVTLKRMKDDGQLTQRKSRGNYFITDNEANGMPSL